VTTKEQPEFARLRAHIYTGIKRTPVAGPAERTEAEA
jgi:hypothetical protein